MSKKSSKKNVNSPFVLTPPSQAPFQCQLFSVQNYQNVFSSSSPFMSLLIRFNLLPKMRIWNLIKNGKKHQRKGRKKKSQTTRKLHQRTCTKKKPGPKFHTVTNQQPQASNPHITKNSISNTNGPKHKSNPVSLSKPTRDQNTTKWPTQLITIKPYTHKPQNRNLQSIIPTPIRKPSNRTKTEPRILINNHKPDPKYQKGRNIFIFRSRSYTFVFKIFRSRVEKKSEKDVQKSKKKEVKKTFFRCQA